MYQQHFNFNAPPFSISPDPHFMFMSQQHQEGYAHLLYGINQVGGFVALTGEVGTGKTLLCQCLLNEVPPNVSLAIILNPKLSANELLANICDELHISYDKADLTLKGLTDSLNSYLIEAYAKGNKTIVLIDEAQNLSLDVLEQIRLLTNLETAQTKLLQIILVGQPELKEILEAPELRQLNQRITARYHLRPFTPSEAEKYIKHRLNICGGRDDIFNCGAIKRIYGLSKGVPRLINIICDRALLGAFVKNTRVVTGKTINEAAVEIFNQPTPTKKRMLLRVAAALAIMSLFAFSLYYLKGKQVKKQSEPIVAIEKNSLTKPSPVTLKEEKEKSFDFYLNQQTSLNIELPKLAQLWGKSVSEEDGCKEVDTVGLHCLFDQTTWEQLVALNRPVIMEFPISKTQKEYALLIKIKDGDPVFQFYKEISFPVENILKLWKGYYVTLWKSPVHSIKNVYPGKRSRAVRWIKEKIAIRRPYILRKPYSTFFDKTLKKEVVRFQKKHHLTPDGIVGTKTFIQLRNNDPLDNSPTLGWKK